MSLLRSNRQQFGFLLFSGLFLGCYAAAAQKVSGQKAATQVADQEAASQKAAAQAAAQKAAVRKTAAQKTATQKVTAHKVAAQKATAQKTAPVTSQEVASKKVPSSPPVANVAAPADTTIRRHGGFTAALIYGNNSSFFGRTQTTRYPYLAGEMTYKSRFGVWASALSYNLFDTSSFVDETDLSAGWDVDLSRRVDASVSYTRFVFAANSPLVKSSVNNSVDSYVGWDWQYVYSRLNGAYLFGESDDFFLMLDNSRNFEIDHVLTRNGYLAIEPRLSAAAGTQRFVEVSQAQQELRGNGKGRNKGKGKGKGQGQPPTPPPTVTTTSTTRFQILSYELRLPVTYSWGLVSAQVAWRYALPVNLLPDDVSGARSYLTASLSLNL